MLKTIKSHVCKISNIKKSNAVNYQQPLIVLQHRVIRPSENKLPYKDFVKIYRWKL